MPQCRKGPECLECLECPMARTQDGSRCTAVVNRSECEYCLWHAKAALKQLTNRRADVQGRSMFEKQLRPVVDRGACACACACLCVCGGGGGIVCMRVRVCVCMCVCVCVAASVVIAHVPSVPARIMCKGDPCCELMVSCTC